MKRGRQESGVLESDRDSSVVKKKRAINFLNCFLVFVHDGGLSSTKDT